MRRADIEVPNHAVAMDARARSACYPRGTFYPLSDGASTCHRQITSPDFRPCSRCPSHSQAPLCTYTRNLIANQAEGTFGRLRYLLGGDRPSQTTHQALSLIRITDRSSTTDATRVVFQRRLHPSWRSSFTVSHLSYTNRTEHQYQAVVKVPGSFRPAARNEHLYS